MVLPLVLLSLRLSFFYSSRITLCSPFFSERHIICLPSNQMHACINCSPSYSPYVVLMGGETKRPNRQSQRTNQSRHAHLSPFIMTLLSRSMQLTLTKGKLAVFKKVFCNAQVLSDGNTLHFGPKHRLSVF